MFSGPQFARFFKVDLQMQTPVSSLWRDQSTKITNTSSEETRRDVGRKYLRRCHEVELEIVAITDHNFAPAADESFIKVLQDENAAVAETMDRTPLVILPGFEVEADVGKGCHVICVFPQDTPLEVVDARLTALQLPPDERFLDGNPRPSPKHLQEIIDAVQKADRYAGLVIAAHATGDKGIFDNDRISEWLQQNEFTNLDLLCLELPKPLDQMSVGWQRLITGGPDCDMSWRRTRPIAYVMSSDCYRLQANPAEPGNHIGHRHTWVKMSQPSLESFRQAFLDRDSRIRFGDSCPDLLFTHPRILSVRVEGTVFIRRLEEIEWSPNLNCLIGSRGTGKSSLVDYMRLLLDRLHDEDLPKTLRQEVLDRANTTLLPESRLVMEVRTAGGHYEIVYEGANNSRSVGRLSSDGVFEPIDVDVRTLFPCRFLSQRQIDHTGRDAAALRTLLDDFIAPELSQLDGQASELVGSIRTTDSEVSQVLERSQRRIALMTERTELEGRLSAYPHASEILGNWSRVERERVFLENARKFGEELEMTDNDSIQRLTSSLSELTDDLAQGPNGSTLQAIREVYERAVESLRQRIRSGLEAFVADTAAPDSKVVNLVDTEWRPSHQEAQAALDAEKARAEQEGTQLEDIQGIPDRIAELTGLLNQIDANDDHLLRLQAERAAKVNELQEIWRQQTTARRRAAADLMGRLTEGDNPPLVDISVGHRDDVDETVLFLASYIPDRRSLNDADLRGALELMAKDDTWEQTGLIDRFVSVLRRVEKDTSLRRYFPSRRETICEVFGEAILRELELVRLADSVGYRVFRQDGTLAGSLGRVSAGQQGTAILNLLLSMGSEPLIVDTPEEGLDSEAVYSELVPLFRTAKERRQIIVATHNANLPVNADAELVVALDAAGYVPDNIVRQAGSRLGKVLSDKTIRKITELFRWQDWQTKIARYIVGEGWATGEAESFLLELGRQRESESRIRAVAPVMGGGQIEYAIGALDRIPVKRAVQDILEGSVEAFRRRTEMYGA